MVDGITISGGGSYAVATDELYRLAQCLETVRDAAAAAKVELDRLPGVSLFDGPIFANPHLHEMQWCARRAATKLEWLEGDASFNACALRVGAEAYGATDHVVAHAIEEINGILGYGAGILAPIFMLTSLRAFAFGAGISFVALSAAHGGPDGAMRAITSWLNDHREVLSNPVTVELIRQTIMSVDETMAGVTRAPYALSQAFESIGLAGVSSSALMAIVLGNTTGVFSETPVTVKKVSSTAATQPPAGLADRVNRLPDPKHNGDGAQIRIDRYEVPGQPARFDVYIAGTVDFSPIAATEAFDLTSNFHGMAEIPAGSYRGIEKALSEAGVTRENPVVFTGHSQGGLLAATLASSGNYNTHGVLTIGAPTGHIPAPTGIPVIAIEHTDDVVTALGGSRHDIDAIVVRRPALSGGALPEDIFFPAHEKTVYAQTALMADQTHSHMLREAIATIDDISTGATQVTSITWLATRNNR
ncbi:MAG: hypothetical protein ACOH1J_04295 [Microbacteriaceae bacterium]